MAKLLTGSDYEFSLRNTEKLLKEDPKIREADKELVRAFMRQITGLRLQGHGIVVMAGVRVPFPAVLPLVATSMRLLGGAKDDIYDYSKRFDGELRRLRGVP